MLTEAQVVALEKAKTEKEAHGEFESEHPGYCGAQDTFYVGNLKDLRHVYQQTFIDTYSKVACAKLYDRKTPITAADMLNDRVVPFFDSLFFFFFFFFPPPPLWQPGATPIRALPRDRRYRSFAHQGRRARRPTASANASTRPC